MGNWRLAAKCAQSPHHIDEVCQSLVTQWRVRLVLARSSAAVVSERRSAQRWTVRCADYHIFRSSAFLLSDNSSHRFRICVYRQRGNQYHNKPKENSVLRENIVNKRTPSRARKPILPAEFRKLAFGQTTVANNVLEETNPRSGIAGDDFLDTDHNYLDSNYKLFSLKGKLLD